MEYFKLLHLAREPFSNSPDPAFFYESGQHKECIQKLELALRLRRGLNVVTGEVGTGKTTLCRQLIQAFSHDPGISACLLLDPDFPDPRTFLEAVVHTITGRRPATEESIPAMKELLKHYLFQKGVEEDRIIVLIVDEGQKMAPDCLETLRELLNFETNEYKLFQVIIFAQNEFSGILDKRPNLADRINLYYRLGPLDFKDSRALIRRRIHLAGDPDAPVTRLFSLPALWRIFRLSGGYPRKIIHLCHQCLLTMIIQNKATVNRRMVGACARRTFLKPRVFRPVTVAVALLLLAGIGLGAWRYSGPEQASENTGRNNTNTIIAAILPPETTGAEPAKIPPAPEPTGITPPPEAPTIIGAEQTALPIFPPEAQEQTTEARSEEAPTVLGTVQVAVGDTLGGLVRKVYGAYTYRYHQAVLAANPELKEPDRLSVGQPLIFPALSTDMSGIPATTWWIALSREPDLDAAVEALRQETDRPLPRRLLARWNRREGLTFMVVLKNCFEDRNSAELERERMDLSDPALSEVIFLEKSDIVVW